MGSCDRAAGSAGSPSEVDCEETLRELDRFLDDELSNEARQAIHEHLDGCVDCLQAFDFHAELKAVVAEKCKNDEIPSGLMDRLQQCLITGELVKDAGGTNQISESPGDGHGHGHG